MDDKLKEKNKKTSYIFTRETFGITILLFCAIVFVMLLTRHLVFAGIGSAICTFMYGTFGYGSYLVIGLLAYLGEWLAFEKKIKISFIKAFTISLTVFILFLLFHAVTTRNFEMGSYGKYISDCYKNAQYGYSGYTFGGVVSSLVVYPIAKLSYVAAYIIFSVLVLACGYVTVLTFGGKNLFANVSFRKKSKKSDVSRISAPDIVGTEAAVAAEYAEPMAPSANNAYVTNEVQPQPIQLREAPATQQTDDSEKFSSKNLGRKILFEKGEFAAESYRRNMIFNENSYFNRPVPTAATEADYLNSFSSAAARRQKESALPETSYTESYSDEILNQPVQASPSNFVYGEKPATDLEGYGAVEGEAFPVQSNDERSERYSEYVRDDGYADANYGGSINNGVEDDTSEFVEDYIEEPPAITPSRDRGVVGFSETPLVPPQITENEKQYNQVIREDKPADDDDVFINVGREGKTTPLGGRRGNAELFDDDEMDDEIPPEVFGRRETPLKDVAREPLRKDSPAPVRKTENTDKSVLPATTGRAQPEAQQPAEEKPKHVWKKYVRPSLDLLEDYPENSNINTGEIEDNKRIIVETLNRFKIASEVSNVTIGPAITRYDVIIIDKTKINQSVKYRDAIAMELKKDNVNAYLNYSKGALSIEVPNNVRIKIGLKGMLASRAFLNSKPGALTFGLGKNIEGEVVCPDITRMPHLLVAGTTGSGKSVCLSTLLVSLLYKYGPEELRLILVDPKQVEFISYDKLPHLMINEIIYECDKAIKALNWAIKEMERRYTLFKEMTENGQATKNLEEYNAHLPSGEEKLPKILIVLDEFGDLMLQAKKDIESRIIKLVQKARAAGIHLILATQRPSVDCITGLIKSNLPTRIGFKVNSFDDARCIFDIGGAEKLLGLGDMYFRSAQNPDLTRIQGCFIDTPEVQRVTDFIKSHNETYFDQSVSDFINTVEQEESPVSLGAGDGDDEEFKIDDTHIKALKYCVTSNQASVSMIQRRFPVGYIKACKIIDWMEKMNYITPSEGSKPRKVLLSKDEFIQIYGDDIDD